MILFARPHANGNNASHCCGLIGSAVVMKSFGGAWIATYFHDCHQLQVVWGAVCAKLT